MSNMKAALIAIGIFCVGAVAWTFFANWLIAEEHIRFLLSLVFGGVLGLYLMYEYHNYTFKRDFHEKI